MGMEFIDVKMRFLKILLHITWPPDLLLNWAKNAYIKKIPVSDCMTFFVFSLIIKKVRGSFTMYQERM